MTKKLRKLYYDSRVAVQVLGCLLQKHSLLDEAKYDITIDDFFTEYHKAVFGAIYNLYQEGVKSITPIEIEMYLNRVSPRHYKVVFEGERDGMDWFDHAIEHSNLSNFSANLERLKKMSILRDSLELGIDVSDILDKKAVDNDKIERQNKELDEMSLQELLAHFDKKVVKLQNKHSSVDNGDYKRAGDNAEKTLQRLKDGETYGLLGLSGYKNKIVYGHKRKKLHVMSSDTGGGKSRTSLGEIAHLIAVELWCHEEEKFMKNPNNPNGELSGIYVGTELDLDTEVDVILWAVISGLETSKILEQDLTPEEEERLDYAIDVVQRSKIHLYDRPDYSIQELKNIVKKHQVEEDVYMLGLDYILLTPSIILEAREHSQGIYTREDQIYLYISKHLKEDIANGLNIYVSSSTQLNRSVDDVNAEKNAGMIRGSFALMDKVDVGSILLEIDSREEDIISDLTKKDEWCPETPTHVEHIFKNRGGKISKARIFKTLNLGHMETKDLFCTDWSYKLLDIEKIEPKPVEEDDLQEVQTNNPRF